MINNMKNNRIAIKEAFFQLQDKYQNLYVDVNLEKKLDIIKFFYRYLNHNGCSEVFPFREFNDIFYDKDHLTMSAYEYIESRMSQFSILFNEHKKAINDVKIEELISLSDVDSSSKIDHTEIISNLNLCYVNINKIFEDESLVVSLNNYDFYLGEWSIPTERECIIESYRDDFESVFGYALPKKLAGYKYVDKLNIDSIRDVFHIIDNPIDTLFKIDRSCLTLSMNGMLISKIMITNPEHITIDGIDGGILTKNTLNGDYYGHFSKSIHIPFSDIYVSKSEAIELKNNILGDDKDSFEYLNKDEKRRRIIKDVLKNGDLSDYVIKIDDCSYESQVTKKEFFRRIIELYEDDYSIRTLFSIQPIDYFKKDKEIKKMLKFKAGAPRKSS